MILLEVITAILMPNWLDFVKKSKKTTNAKGDSSAINLIFHIQKP